MRDDTSIFPDLFNGLIDNRRRGIVGIRHYHRFLGRRNCQDEGDKGEEGEDGETHGLCWDRMI